MKRIAIAALLMFAGITGTALASTPASKGTNDQVVEMRADRRAADNTYNSGMKAAKAERKAKVDAAVEAAVKDAKAQGKDPNVAAREARSQANKATKADFDAKKKALAADRKAAYKAADAKAKPAK